MNKAGFSRTLTFAASLLLAAHVAVAADAPAPAASESGNAKGTTPIAAKDGKAAKPAAAKAAAKADARMAKSDTAKEAQKEVAATDPGLDVPSARNRPATPPTATTGTRAFVRHDASTKAPVANGKKKDAKPDDAEGKPAAK